MPVADVMPEDKYSFAPVSPTSGDLDLRLVFLSLFDFFTVPDAGGGLAIVILVLRWRANQLSDIKLRWLQLERQFIAAKPGRSICSGVVHLNRELQGIAVNAMVMITFFRISALCGYLRYRAKFSRLNRIV